MLSYEQTLRLFEKEAHPFRENGCDVLPVFAFWALFWWRKWGCASWGMEFADTRGRVSLRVYSLFCHHPFSWIVIDVFPGLVIILLVADHMIVISGLPDVLAVFLVAKPFECSYKSCNHGCPGRRDTPPGVSVSLVGTPLPGCPFLS